MLEAVASYDLWIWHAFFEIAGANNDLAVLNNSSLFDNFFDDIAHVAPFEVNGVTYEKRCYLADGIYLQWATFVKSFTVARDKKNALFERRQEGAQKDVERAFGVFQGRVLVGIELEKKKGMRVGDFEMPPAETSRANTEPHPNSFPLLISRN
ncbi:ALP1-like protein [Tanacetum coccineum]